MTFDLIDIPRIAVLAFLEILLSADNAVVLGLLASRLPAHQQTKALYIGTFSAFGLRAVALLLIAYLVTYKWLQLLGAAYLLYLSLRHFTKRKTTAPSRHPTHFWQTVVLIELFDLAFAIDSILAGLAFIDAKPSKLWIVYVGGMLGVFVIRYAAHLFTLLIHRFPSLEGSAYLMIGWIGLKLGFLTLAPPPLFIDPLFWMGLSLLFVLGFVKKKPV